MTYLEFDFLDQPEWSRQQSQSGSGTNHAVAYKRIQFRYNDIGQLTYVNRFETPTTVVGTPSLRTVLEYDDANQIESITHRAAFHQQTTTLLNDYLFGFDDAGRIQSIDSLLDSLSSFTFSTDNQLTVADHDPTRPDENYSYDANGNRIGGSYTVGSQNRTLSDGTFNYQYDNEGNRTRRTRNSDLSYEEFSYDFRNRLTEVKFFTAAGVLQQAVAYTYDAFNNLVRRQVDTDGDGAYDDLDQIFAGLDGNNSSLEFETTDGSTVSADDLSHRRLWGPLVDQLVSSEEVDSLISAGEVLWALQDQVGTIRDIGQFDPTAGPSGPFEIVSHRVYNSFGQLTDEYDPATQSPSSIALSHGFTGKFTDDLTGLTHHQHRWFDPQLGKWLTEDPIGFSAGDINTTRYVANNPVQYIDPTGLFKTTTAVFGLGGTNGDSGHGILAYQEIIPVDLAEYLDIEYELQPGFTGPFPVLDTRPYVPPSQRPTNPFFPPRIRPWDEGLEHGALDLGDAGDILLEVIKDRYPEETENILNIPKEIWDKLKPKKPKGDERPPGPPTLKPDFEYKIKPTISSDGAGITIEIIRRPNKKK